MPAVWLLRPRLGSHPSHRRSGEPFFLFFMKKAVLWIRNGFTVDPDPAFCLMRTGSREPNQRGSGGGGISGFWLVNAFLKS